MKKVVCIGGGTGLATLLIGLKQYDLDIAAIVTMTDDGTSTGRLRRQYGILPPGDIRKTIIALAQKEDLLTELFKYRFHRGKGLAGHSLGNLLILALEKITGNFAQAVAAASQILATRGKVIPATLENINLVSEHQSGKKIIGERKAFNLGHKDPIVKASLDKKDVTANSEAISAIRNADIILIGPGSLWTSIIPNLLIKDITKEIVKNKKARKIYIANVSTERGETQNYSIKDHIDALVSHSHANLFHRVLVNDKIVKLSDKVDRLGEINNITTSKQKINSYQIIRSSIINSKNPLYHDSKKTARAIMELINGKSRKIGRKN